MSAFGAEELTSLSAGDATRPGRFRGPRAASGTGPSSGSSGEHNFNQRIRGEKHRHYASVAQRLFELSRSGGIRSVVLAGMGADADAVEPHLHPYVARQVIGTARLNPKSVTAAKVMAAVLDVSSQSERARESEHVSQLREALGTGWAVNGVDPVLDALAHGQVRTLLVEPTWERSGFRCEHTARLVLEDSECSSEGRSLPVPDIVDEAIEEALRQGGHIEVVEDDEARSDVEGLAAILRFKQR